MRKKIGFNHEKKNLKNSVTECFCHALNEEFVNLLSYLSFDDNMLLMDCL